MITTEPIKGFEPVYLVVSCFVERADGKIIMLLRLPDKSEGNKWGVPAGKIGQNENPLEAIVREVKEETGIDISDRPVNLFDTYYVRYPEYDFLYHVYHVMLPNSVKAKVSAEHQAMRWISPKNALKLNLVKHQDDCIKFFYLS